MSSTTISAESTKAAATAVTLNYDSFFIYIQEFRVEQCQLFLQHKCKQHRPYNCFYWHFMNQRRRRPKIWDDSVSYNKLSKQTIYYNYNPDVYCDTYDEQTGICLNGDNCAFVHRNAGDTERRYHPRYYKVAYCLFQTNSIGQCIRNGPHCFMAHFREELNPFLEKFQEKFKDNPKLIISQRKLVQNTLENDQLFNDDNCWNDIQYVLENYKTVQCQRPPRVCRQGYACPQYHNPRDRRRNPLKFTYRSTPCPAVKPSDEWQEPSVCEKRDLCQLCHSRTEQQFHPDIYKSTRCQDILNSLFCPRGNFCAFAHCERELKTNRGTLMMRYIVSPDRAFSSGATSFSDDHCSYPRNMISPTKSNLMTTNFYPGDADTSMLSQHRSIYNSGSNTPDKNNFNLLLSNAALSNTHLDKAFFIVSPNQQIVQASIIQIPDSSSLTSLPVSYANSVTARNLDDFLDDMTHSLSSRSPVTSSVTITTTECQCDQENRELTSNQELQTNSGIKEFELNESCTSTRSQSIASNDCDNSNVISTSDDLNDVSSGNVNKQTSSSINKDYQRDDPANSQALTHFFQALGNRTNNTKRQISLEAMISRNLEYIGIEDGNFVFEGDDKTYTGLEPQTPMDLPDTGEADDPPPLFCRLAIRNNLKTEVSNF
ncbi:hypothetical protein GJ496_003437 [Pomphorhynchus laevis]|nr:hypothetical protein GJ496_003437 [Pomphorhynchus laevis]